MGNIVLWLSSWTSLGLPGFPLTCVGLLFIAAGTRGIKPCVCSFGGDQFQLPQQRPQLEAFFRMIYFVVYVGATLAALVSPLLRTAPCLGRDTCFPAAFGLPAALMVCYCEVAFRCVCMKDPEGNILGQVCKCLSRALWRRVRRGRKGAHWLDGAGPDALVADMKVLLSLLVLAAPLPVFSALFDMVGSRWTFQAVQLNGDLGHGVALRPDQMSLCLGLLVMLILVVIEVAVNPLLARARLLTTPLQRMSVGGLMAAASFLCAAVLQTYVDEQGGAAKLHMLWQIPQYLFLALSEVWFGISLLEFAYKEAPLSMKTIIQAVFLLTTSAGDTIVIILTSANLFSSRATEFFVYAGLMVAAMLVFMFLAARYTYADLSSTSTKDFEPLCTVPAEDTARRKNFGTFSD